MPKWYRLNSGGSWAPLKIYRLNTSGTWAPMKQLYRLYTDGIWRLVHTSQEVPSATTSPTLVNQVSSADNFFGGDTLTLTRGAYTNTTANSDTTYRMRIYKGTNPALALNDTNWTVAASANYTGANSTASTTLTYSLTDADANDGYYLVGEVRVNNDANTSGSNNYDFETANRVLSRISFTISGLTASNITDNDVSLSWSIGGISTDSYIHSQRLVIRQTNSSGAIIQDVVPSASARNFSFSNVLQPSTLYHATIEATANDGWKASASPTKLTDTTTFITKSPSPVNTVAPTISPTNGRTPPTGYLGYLPVSTQLTSNTGSWSNVSGSTTYSYEWFKEDSVTGLLTSIGTGSQQTFSVSDVDDFVFVKVTATNSDGGFGTITSGTYILSQAVAVGTITPTSANQNVSTTFSFNISHYPTSYVINWGDGTSDSYSVTANTSTVNASHAHTYTSSGPFVITVTAQPGNKQNTATVNVAAPISIGFDANGGTISSGPGNGLTTYTYVGNAGSSFTAPSAFRQHFTLSTWRSPLSGGDPKFLTAGLNYTYGSGEVATSTTFFAIWTANTYTVSYNYNGGTGSVASNSAVYPGSVTLPTPDTRSGFTFNGWYTASSGGSFIGNAGSPYSPTSNITLFAQWTIQQYTVTWNATNNGGTGGGTTGPFNAGSSHTAPAASRNSFTVTFSSQNATSGSPAVSSVTGTSPFIRWADTAGLTNGTGDFSISVSAGGSFIPTSSITMFARWNQTASNAITLSGQGTLARTNFTFGGWNIGGTTYAAGSSFTPTGNVTANPVWVANPPNNPTLLSGFPKQIGSTVDSNINIGATFDSTATSVLVEYGTSTAYGQSFNITTSGNDGKTADFTPGTTIFYRLRSFNSTTNQYSSGITGSFTTQRMITSVTASQSSTAPFVTWSVQAHGMRSMSTFVYKSTLVGGNIFQTGANDPILSANTTTGAQTRQTSVTPGGVGYRYYLQFNRAWSGNGGTGTAFAINLLTNTFTHVNGANTTVYTA